MIKIVNLKIPLHLNLLLLASNEETVLSNPTFFNNSVIIIEKFINSGKIKKKVGSGTRSGTRSGTGYRSVFKFLGGIRILKKRKRIRNNK